MNYNVEFEDTMDNINNVAKGYGFVNGIKWAQEAQKRGTITFGQYKKYENAHNLRVRFSHGSARDISISYETYQIALEFEQKIEKSSLRQRDNTNNSGNNTNSNPNKQNPDPNDNSYNDYYQKFYGAYLNSPNRILSRMGKEIQTQLRIMRKYPKATYDDLVEAAYQIYKDCYVNDLEAMCSAYGVHGPVKKDSTKRQLAEKMIATLDDSEIDALMGV